MTNESYLKAKRDLQNIIGNHSLNDYISTNYKQGKRLKSFFSRKSIPYTLSHETSQAREIYHIICSNSYKSIALHQETKIKAFLLPYRTFRTQFLNEVTHRKVAI